MKTAAFMLLAFLSVATACDPAAVRLWLHQQGENPDVMWGPGVLDDGHLVEWPFACQRPNQQWLDDNSASGVVWWASYSTNALPDTVIIPSLPGEAAYKIYRGPDGEVLWIKEHGSPKTTMLEQRQDLERQLSTNEVRRSRIERLTNDVAAINVAVDEMMAIDLSATGTVGKAIAATSGSTKTALTALRNALIDVRQKAKVACNNSAQAIEKIRKEIK